MKYYCNCKEIKKFLYNEKNSYIHKIKRPPQEGYKQVTCRYRFEIINSEGRKLSKEFKNYLKAKEFRDSYLKLNNKTVKTYKFNSKFREVNTKNELCVDCGHYALYEHDNFLNKNQYLSNKGRDVNSSTYKTERNRIVGEQYIQQYGIEGIL